jgi:hypothetical protein
MGAEPTVVDHASQRRDAPLQPVLHRVTGAPDKSG